jgi:ATP-binding cassette subfamily F protein 3
MDSREVLIEALRQFEGSVVFISHDRHLINAIGTKVIEVRDGRLAHYPGDWEYYQWKKAQEGEQRAGAPAPTGPGGPEGTAPSKPALAPQAGGSAGASRSAEQKPATSTPAKNGAETGGVVSPGASAKKGGPSAPAAGVTLSYQERKDVVRRHRKVEKRILELEDLQSRLALVLSDPEHMSDYELLFSTSEELRLTRDELTGLYEEWEGLAETVASLDVGT